MTPNVGNGWSRCIQTSGQDFREAWTHHFENNSVCTQKVVATGSTFLIPKREPLRGRRARSSGRTGLPHLQEHAPPKDPTAGLCLGSYGVPGGWAFFMDEIPLLRDQFQHTWKKSIHFRIKSVPCSLLSELHGARSCRETRIRATALRRRNPISKVCPLHQSNCFTPIRS